MQADHVRTVIDFRKRRYAMVTRDIIDKDTKLKRPVDIAVYAVLCMYADNEGKDAHPRVSTIAKKARCSERTARRSLADLADAGYIEIHTRHDGRGIQTTNQYVLLDVDLS